MKKVINFKTIIETAAKRDCKVVATDENYPEKFFETCFENQYGIDEHQDIMIITRNVEKYNNIVGKEGVSIYGEYYTSVLESECDYNFGYGVYFNASISSVSDTAIYQNFCVYSDVFALRFFRYLYDPQSTEDCPWKTYDLIIIDDMIPVTSEVMMHVKNMTEDYVKGKIYVEVKCRGIIRICKEV